MARKQGVRITILVEDKTLERFVREVLFRIGFSRNELRFQSYPVGKGSAKNWIDLQYPALVRILRSKNFQQNIAVVVGTEADELTVDQRNKRLAQSLNDGNFLPRNSDEKIVHIIPKWNIETWLLYFSGDKRDEDHNYKTALKKPNYQASATAFVDENKRFRLDNTINTQPSLKIAYLEIDRLGV